MFKLFIKEIRLQQWVKNILIFLPAIFANKIFDLNNLSTLIIAFIAFSLTASSLYIVNDIFDQDKDRSHPEKKDRPIASGKLSIKAALILSIIMLLSSFVMVFFINQTLIWLLVSYVILILLYSIYLKNLPIIDMVVIAIGFIIRIFFGSMVIDVPTSNWIIVTTFFFALFFVAIKRRLELSVLADKANDHRVTLTTYNSTFYNILIGATATLALASYSIYTLQESVIIHFRTEALIYSIPFVFIFITRLIYVSTSNLKQNTSDPTNIIFTDKTVFLSLVGWLFSILIIILWHSTNLK